MSNNIIGDQVKNNENDSNEVENDNNQLENDNNDNNQLENNINNDENKNIEEDNIEENDENNNKDNNINNDEYINIEENNNNENINDMNENNNNQVENDNNVEDNKDMSDDIKDNNKNNYKQDIELKEMNNNNNNNSNILSFLNNKDDDDDDEKKIYQLKIDENNDDNYIINNNFHSINVSSNEKNDNIIESLLDVEDSIEGASSDAISNVIAILFQVKSLWKVCNDIMHTRREKRRKKLQIVRRQCRSCAGSGGLSTMLYNLTANLMPSAIHNNNNNNTETNNETNNSVLDDDFYLASDKPNEIPQVPYNEYENVRHPNYMKSHAYLCSQLDEQFHTLTTDLLILKKRCVQYKMKIDYIDFDSELSQLRNYQETRHNIDIISPRHIESTKKIKIESDGFVTYSATTLKIQYHNVHNNINNIPNNRALGMVLYELCKCLQNVLKILENVEVILNDLPIDSTSPIGLSFDSSTFRELFIANTRINALQILLSYAEYMPKDDILMAKERENLSFETIMHPEDTEKLRLDVEKFMNIIDFGTAATLYAMDSKNSVTKFFNTIVGGCMFGVRSKEKNNRSNMLKHARDSSMNAQLELWSLPESCVGRTTFTTLMIKSVAKVESIFIPRRNLGIINDNGIHALLISSSKYDFCENIVIHFHGGGFVATSSFTHQNYTRQWANRSGMTIISVDYSLAPQYQYPIGLDDCYDAYRYIIENNEKLFGRKIRKILLAGDSSGGNLVIGVIIRCLRDGYRVPDGILLAYPALTLVEHFSPSILLSLNDSLIPYAFIQACKEAYLGENYKNLELDPLVSVSGIDDNILGSFPPTRIMVSDLDIFHDECVRFANRLNHLNCNIKLNVYAGLPHGYLNMDTEFSPYTTLRYECHKAVQDSCAWLNELANI